MKDATEARTQAPAMGFLSSPWSMWTIAAVYFAFGFFARVAPSVMVEELMRDFQATGAIVGTLSALYFYAYAFLQVPIGIGLDRIGVRRMLTFATVVCGCGVMLFGFAETLAVAYVARILIGAGSACAMIGTLKLSSVWFPPQRFAFMFGLTVILGAAGAVLGQGPLASLIETTGWRSVHIGGGLFALVIAAVLWLVVRDAPKKTEGAKPESAPLLQGLRFIMRTPQIWILALINATMVAPLLAFGTLWGVPYMTAAYGLSKPAAAFAASMMLIGHAFLSAAVGWFSDRIGRRKPVLAICTFISLVTFAAVIYVPGLPIAMAYFCLFAYGCFSGATSVCYATAKENNPIRFTGVTSGFVNMTTMGLSAVFQAVLGWLLDLQWDGTLAAGARIYALEAYRTAMLALIATSILAVVLSLLVRETHCRGLRD